MVTTDRRMAGEQRHPAIAIVAVDDRVLALTPAEVAALHHGMRDKPDQANRALRVLSKMMNQAEAWDLRLDRSYATKSSTSPWEISSWELSAL